jgi:hypothetical protein
MRKCDSYLSFLHALQKVHVPSQFAVITPMATGDHVATSLGT